MDALDIFPASANHHRLRVEATDDVRTRSRRPFRDNPENMMAMESTSCNGFVTAGLGAGISGIVVANANAANSKRASVLRRRIDDELIDEERYELNPDHQLIRVYRSACDEDIELQVEGGPTVPFTLRWDPLVHFVE